MANLKLSDLRSDMKKVANPEKVKGMSKFFQAFPGGYGEGDRFLAIKVPDQRKIAKKYLELRMADVEKLLCSTIHEERLVSLFIMNLRFAKGDEKQKKQIYSLYTKKMRFVNNWDLVDSSADKIVGAYLEDKNREPIYKLAKSKNMWRRRIAMLSTFWYIKKGSFKDSLKIADLLKSAEEDIIHKAVGWMVREVGNRNLKVEEKFLKPRYKKMPRTMLRYAIEKFPEPKRKAYLAGKI